MAKSKPKSRAKPKSVVIVESPAKARTINKFLGRDFVAKASMGHVRDLPKSKLGIDIDNGFEPDYRTIRGRGKTLKELQDIVKKADKVYLAPDQDREGEAIAWHLKEALNLEDDRTFRVLFNEITKRAIEKAFEKPEKLSMDKVYAQQARRILDRIVGYKLSPLLWSKVAKNLSAGRVQSVAVRLIADRELEIRAFVPEEYWKIGAQLARQGEETVFKAELHKVDGADHGLTNEADTMAVVKRLEGQPFTVDVVNKKQRLDKPGPPLTTSLLQQQASTKLHFSAKKTMLIAQHLYEGKDIGAEGTTGLITYMRTDSFRIADEALAECRAHIGERYGAPYLPEQPNVYSSRKSAQEAHEAIRPTSVLNTPDAIAQYLKPDELKLYRLIWDRMVASQMTPAVYMVTTVDVGAAGCTFRVKGKVLEFDGHATLTGVNIRSDEQQLPALTEGETLDCRAIEPTQHFTQPPPRFTEATLVKTLKKEGIGRPSTYAPIISRIQDVGYVELESRRFQATDLGILVTGLLVDSFPSIVDKEFTSKMEEDLDRIEESEVEWHSVLDEFYGPFVTSLDKAQVEMRDYKKDPVVSEIVCDKCGAMMVERWNKYGKFLGCPQYPECKNRMSFGEEGEVRKAIVTEHVCEKCGANMVLKEGKNGTFLACPGYPECKNTFSVDAEGNPIRPEETEHACPKCGKAMMLRSGRRGKFLACSGYPECRSTCSVDADGKPIKEEPADEKCEKCDSPMVVKSGRRGKFLACTAYPKCRNTAPYKGEEEPEDAGVECDKCGKPMVVRSGRRGPFVACSGYPTCRNTKPMDEVEAEKAAKAG